jgi:hypothetical protein
VGVLKKKTPPQKQAAFSFSVPGTGTWLHLQHWLRNTGMFSGSSKQHDRADRSMGGRADSTNRDGMVLPFGKIEKPSSQKKDEGCLAT